MVTHSIYSHGLLAPRNDIDLLGSENRLLELYHRLLLPLSLFVGPVDKFTMTARHLQPFLSSPTPSFCVSVTGGVGVGALDLLDLVGGEGLVLDHVVEAGD